jgi:hypothetical protein
MSLDFANRSSPYPEPLKVEQNRIDKMVSPGDEVTSIEAIFREAFEGFES